MDKHTANSAIATIGIDLAKTVFQLHGIDVAGKAVLRRSMRRREFLAFMSKLPASVVGIEACATAHYWARELKRLGHEAKLIPPAYVKAYVRRQQNDAADAAAICEAATRPSMRFVPVKSAEQQGVLMLHRARELLVGQRTALINALRGHLAEFGVPARPRPAGPADAAGGRAVHPEAHAQSQRRGAVRALAGEPVLPILLRRAVILSQAAVRPLVADPLAPAPG
jgi:transposase